MQTPELETKNGSANADKNTTNVTVAPDCVGLAMDNASQKRFGTIEREPHKQTSNPPSTKRPSEGILSYASVKKEPSVNSAPAVSARPGENAYVSVKKCPSNLKASVDCESIKPTADSAPAVAQRSDDRKTYASVKKYTTDTNITSAIKGSVTETPDPPYADKESTADDMSSAQEGTQLTGIDASPAEQPAYVVVEPTGIDVNAANASPVEQPGYVVVEPTGTDVSSAGQTVNEDTELTGPAEQPAYAVVESTGIDVEQPMYVDIESNEVKDNLATQPSGSSDTLLRGRAGRHHDSVNDRAADGAKDGHVGLQTWATHPEKADVTKDMSTDRNCKTYMSVVSDKQSQQQGSQDCATYVSVVVK